MILALPCCPQWNVPASPPPHHTQLMIGIVVPHSPNRNWMTKKFSNIQSPNPTKPKQKGLRVETQSEGEKKPLTHLNINKEIIIPFPHTVTKSDWGNVATVKPLSLKADSVLITTILTWFLTRYFSSPFPLFHFW